ncbi:uncharacterized protein LOC143231312 [Tachypleus tridentatus]|uniref:uncharacterized protein LOC143231312 n=1 Tax=Tachypleus tridentatus TaxID=6853 RepID=UPI003FCFC4BF
MRPKTSNKFEGDFESGTTTSEYQNVIAEKTKPIRHRNNLQQEGTMEFQTTSQSDYPQRTTEPRSKEMRPKTSNKFEGDFESGTTNSEYQNVIAEKTKPIRHPNNLQQEGTMDFHTTSQSDYSQRTIEPRSKEMRPKTSNNFEGEFEGTTTTSEYQKSGTTNSEYQNVIAEKTKAIRPPNNLNQEGTMEFQTTSQSDYSQRTIEPRNKEMRPKTSNKFEGDFGGKTTTSEYQKVTAEKTKAIRHPNNLQQEGTMDFQTTSQSDYSQKTSEPRNKEIRPKTSNKFEGDFAGTTTTSEYQKVTPEKTKAIRHPNNLQQEGAMDFQTTSQSDYSQKTSELRNKEMRPKTSNKFEGDFESGTTTSEYQNVIAEKTKPIRHPNNLQQEGTLGLSDNFTIRLLTKNNRTKK